MKNSKSKDLTLFLSFSFFSYLTNMLKRCWIIIKLIYLHLLYWMVGMQDDEFYITKGSYFIDLNWYYHAIPNYKKALNVSKDPRIYNALGVCYLRIGKFNIAVEHFRIAYSKLDQPDIALGLAITEYETGNLERCRELIQKLSKIEHELYTDNKNALRKLKDLVGQKVIKEETHA